MTAGGPDETNVDLDVLDATGEHIGRVEGIPLSTLARHLPVTLDDDAKTTLDVPDETIDLPAQLIRRRGKDELELSKNLDELREMLSEFEDLDSLDDA